MDLAASPDFEAAYCYLIVLLIALAVAYSQISQRMLKAKAPWIMGQTWVLLFAFTLFPVILFWALDRSGAVRDTSLFAALIVGFGYRQIVTGTLTAIKVPGEVSSIWKPFAAWTSRIAEQIRDRISRRDKRLQARVISTLAQVPEALDRLKSMVKTHSETPEEVAELEKQLQGMRDRFASLGDDAVNRNVAKLLYEKAAAIEEFEYLMFRNGITGRWPYYWYAREWRSKALALAVALFLLVALLIGLRYIDASRTWISYYTWRLQKANTSEIDRYRARQALSSYLLSDGRAAKQACRTLAAVLRRPSLPTGSVDSILQLLIPIHDTPAIRATLATTLIDGLRSDNLDVRARIHPALKHLAEKWHLEVPPGLAAWEPNQGDSVVDLERRVEAWQQVFTPILPNVAAPRPASARGAPGPGGNGAQDRH
jgi:hypothetical protein